MQKETANDMVLAVDIGATSIKFCFVDFLGELVGTPKRRLTPYPCGPEHLVEVIATRINLSDIAMVGVGFPGEFRDGHVVHPGNLSREHGAGTPINKEVHDRWCGFNFEGILREKTNKDVRVVNDATMAALGCVEGKGVELVLALGTGVGLALVKDGQLVPVRDIGAEVISESKTFDELLGEQGRAQDADKWLTQLKKSVATLSKEFSVDTIHLVGGNARRISPSLFKHVQSRIVITGNNAPLRGAPKLFYS